MSDLPTVRLGQMPEMLDREAFGRRFRGRFQDPAFASEHEALVRLEEIAWQGYHGGRKAPRMHPAGPGHADPSYALSDDWRDASDRLKAAQARWADATTASRVLVVVGSSRNDGTCPGEMSKTFRLATLAGETLTRAGVDWDLLDLSRLASDPDLHIHPCKGCASTAMPLCHWPCSCYPNHGNGQVNDWMNEVYERWVSAHGVLLVTPVYWYQAASPLKLMMDRLVCADGGNPDPTLTGGKDAAKAKALERDGWDYPKHLAGRAYGVVVHGDVAGIEGVRRSLSDWLDWMGLVESGPQSRLDRFVGYYEPYWNSHDTLDGDEALQEEVRNAARAVAGTVARLRAGEVLPPDRDLRRPRPK